MRRMTTRELVAQLVVVPFYGENPASKRREFQEYARLVGQTGVGGMILLNRVQGGIVRNAEPMALAAFLNRMQKLAKVPLIVAGDFERGSSMRVANTAKFPHAMAYGAANNLEATRKTGAATAREARALGVHWVLGPVADVNNNPDNPIINTRSFGESPELVSAHVKAYIEGAHSARRDGILVTAKHFPGQGDTATDTHLGLAKVTGDRERLEQLELRPFRAAIAAGVDGMLMGHLFVPAVDEREIPATVSSKVVNGLLRRELGFEGLAVTDAMDMQGLTKQFSSGEAAVRAIEAGMDVLLIPANADAAIKGVVDAVKSGRITLARIQQSVMKVLVAKQRLGLFQNRLVNLEQISEQIDAPEYADLAQSVAEQALATMKNDLGVLPLGDAASACLVTLAENRQSNSGKRMIEEALARSPKMRTVWLDPSLKAADLSETASQLGTCSKIVIAGFVAAASFRGDVALPANLTVFVNEVIGLKRPVIFCALGSPYLLRKFPEAAAQVATFSTTITSESALVRGLFGEIPMGAKSPVTVSAP
jgi:beta-N-acetylhexosaminidase